MISWMFSRAWASWGELDLRLYVCVVDGRTGTWTLSVAASANIGQKRVNRRRIGFISAFFIKSKSPIIKQG